MIRLLLVAIAFVVFACGGVSVDTTDAESSAALTTQGTETPTDQPETTEAPIDEPAPASLPGGITLVIGEETWEFEGAVCAFQNAPAGQEGSEWNVSMEQGDYIVKIADNRFGQAIAITDMATFGGSFNWEGQGDAISLSVEGNDITGEGTFTDRTGAEQPTRGTLTATCADWVGG